MSCRLTQLGPSTVLFALHIPRLVLKILLNQSYGMIIVLLCLWALEIALFSFIIGNKIGEKSVSMEFEIKTCTTSSNKVKNAVPRQMIINETQKKKNFLFLARGFFFCFIFFI